MPFAHNEATRYISPTKTPEYLAAGCPVASTGIHDVVEPYGRLGPRRDRRWSRRLRRRLPARSGDAIAAVHRRKGRRPARPDVLGPNLGGDRRARRGSHREPPRRPDQELTAAELSPAQCSCARREPGPMRRYQRRDPSQRSSSPMSYDVVVVGAGFAGSVMAERFASQMHKRVLVIDRRPHIGGNAYDELDAAGILIHRYGPHIFHTNAAEIVEYLSSFTGWRPYEHRVLAACAASSCRSRSTGRRSTRSSASACGPMTRSRPSTRREPSRSCAIASSEDVVVGAVGRELYELFFRGYTTEAVGPRPEPARCVGDGAGTDAHERRRPLLHRSVPGDARRGLHGDVRADAGPPADRGPDRHRFRRHPRRARLPDAGLHGPVDAYLRAPIRTAPVPLASVRVRDAAATAVPADRDGQLPGRDRCPVHPDQRVQAPHRSAPRRDDDRPRVPAGERRPVLPDPAPRERGAIRRYRALADGDARRAFRRSPRDVQVLQHGPGRGPGARDVPADRRTPGPARPDRPMDRCQLPPSGPASSPPI